MNFGYLNAVILLTWFIWAAHTSEQYLIKCLVNPNSTLNITLDQDPTNVRYVSILKGDKEIAASRGVYGGWNDALSSKYRDRLTLSPGRTNFTVYLEPVLISDKGNYTTAVTLETGHRFKTHWNVALRETVQEPKLKGTFEIIVDKRGDKYHCTCGEFEELGEPRVEFRWNITDEKDHSLLCSSNNSLHCSALWPVSKCQVLIQNWTDEHIGKITEEVSCRRCLSVGAVVGIVTAGIVIIILIIVIVIVIYKHKKRKTNKNGTEYTGVPESTELCITPFAF